jgi:hypothetical protein
MRSTMRRSATSVTQFSLVDTSTQPIPLPHGERRGVSSLTDARLQRRTKLSAGVSLTPRRTVHRPHLNPHSRGSLRQRLPGSRWAG